MVSDEEPESVVVTFDEESVDAESVESVCDPSVDPDVPFVSLSVPLEF